MGVFVGVDVGSVSAKLAVAMYRIHRSKEISDLDKDGAVARLTALRRGWHVILPDDPTPRRSR